MCSLAIPFPIPIELEMMWARERANALACASQEVNEFKFAARNEVDWLNEHMNDVLANAKDNNVPDLMKTPGGLRGKTPRTGRKPLTDITPAVERSIDAVINSPFDPAQQNSVRKAGTIFIAEDQPANQSSPLPKTKLAPKIITTTPVAHIETTVNKHDANLDVDEMDTTEDVPAATTADAAETTPTASTSQKQPEGNSVSPIYEIISISPQDPKKSTATKSIEPAQPAHKSIEPTASTPLVDPARKRDGSRRSSSPWMPSASPPWRAPASPTPARRTRGSSLDLFKPAKELMASIRQKIDKLGQPRSEFASSRISRVSKPANTTQTVVQSTIVAEPVAKQTEEVLAPAMPVQRQITRPTTLMEPLVQQARKVSPPIRPAEVDVARPTTAGVPVNPETKRITPPTVLPKSRITPPGFATKPKVSPPTAEVIEVTPRTVSAPEVTPTVFASKGEDSSKYDAMMKRLKADENRINQLRELGTLGKSIKINTKQMSPPTITQENEPMPFEVVPELEFMGPEKKYRQRSDPEAHQAKSPDAAPQPTGSLRAARPAQKRPLKPSTQLAQKPAPRSIRVGTASQRELTKPKALLAAARKKEQDEREAQRKLEMKEAAQKQLTEKRKLVAEKRPVLQKNAHEEREGQRGIESKDPAQKQTQEKRKLVAEKKPLPQKHATVPTSQQTRRGELGNARVALKPPPTTSLRAAADMNRSFHQPHMNPAGPSKRVPQREVADTIMQDAPSDQYTTMSTYPNDESKAGKRHVMPPVRPSNTLKPHAKRGLEPETAHELQNGQANATNPKRRKTAERKELAYNPPRVMPPPKRPSAMRREKAMFSSQKVALNENIIPANALEAEQPEETGEEDEEDLRTPRTKSVDEYNRIRLRDYPPGNSENISLPDIDDSEDEDDDLYDYEDRPKKKAWVIPDWAQGEALDAQMEKQGMMDADYIFGKIKPVDLCELFPDMPERHTKFRKRSSSADWSQHALTQKEVEWELKERRAIYTRGHW